VRTRTRIARILALGATIGAATRFYEAPYDPSLFWNLVALGLISFYVVSRYRHEEDPISYREALSVYLSLPAAAMSYYHDPNALTGLWIVASALWAITTYIARDLGRID